MNQQLEQQHVLVTGGNRGIGLELCRQLLRKGAGDNLDGDDSREDVRAGKWFVWLGTRSVEKGEAVIETYKSEVEGMDEVERDGWNNRVRAVALDVTDSASISAAVKVLKGEGVTLHCLVNNAGVAMDLPWAKGTYDTNVCEPTLAVNYFGVKNCFHAFKPLFHPTEGRVVSVSSGAGNTNMEKMSPARQKDVMANDLTEDAIDGFVASFQSEFVQSNAKELPCTSASGWHLQAYGFSKAMVNAFTRVVAKENPNLLITCCTPGFVDTEMVATYSGDGTKKSVEDGTRTPMWLITGDANEIKNGRMYGNDLALLTWVGYNVDTTETQK
eukprot:m.151981 g.151981  ORF g.151981 m.151981 type:complete len:328 (+) comp13296_c0_seq4:70-1053(+)